MLDLLFLEISNINRKVLGLGRGGFMGETGGSHSLQTNLRWGKGQQGDQDQSNKHFSAHLYHLLLITLSLASLADALLSIVLSLLF